MQSGLSFEVLAVDEVLVVVVAVVALLFVVVISQFLGLDRRVLAQFADDVRTAVVVRTLRGGVKRRTVVNILDGPRRAVIQQHPDDIGVAGDGGQMQRRLTAMISLIERCRFAVVELTHDRHQTRGVLLLDAQCRQVKTRVSLTVILVDLPHHPHHSRTCLYVLFSLFLVSYLHSRS